MKVNGADVTGAYIAVPAFVVVTTQSPAAFPVISSEFAIVQGTLSIDFSDGYSFETLDGFKHVGPMTSLVDLKFTMTEDE